MNNFNLNNHDAKARIQKVTTQLTTINDTSPLTSHINRYPLPSKAVIIKILNDLFDIIFPGYYSNKEITDLNMQGHIENKIHCVYEALVGELQKSFLQEHVHNNTKCEICTLSGDKAVETALGLLEKLDFITQAIATDVQAAYAGDPAAKSFSEIIFSYPCIIAITIHRIAHELHKLEVPFIPRIMSEHAHNVTGIDIHPGATIGNHFFIDHGTGVVIGETTVIGDFVKIYQSVTLGAQSFRKDEEGNIIKGLKRHPTIEDKVTIYAGATILGGDTIIGTNSVIGGNVWITESVPPHSKVMQNFSNNNTIISKRKRTHDST